MIEIKDLLVSFRNNLFKEEIRKVAIAQVLKDVVGLEVKTEDIEIKNGVLYLNAKPIYKNEILLKKDKILSELEKFLSRKSPDKII